MTKLGKAISLFQNYANMGIDNAIQVMEEYSYIKDTQGDFTAALFITMMETELNRTLSSNVASA